MGPKIDGCLPDDWNKEPAAKEKAPSPSDATACYRLLDHNDMIRADDEFLEDDAATWTRIDLQHRWNIGSFWHSALKPIRRIISDKKKSSDRAKEMKTVKFPICQGTGGVPTCPTCRKTSLVKEPPSSGSERRLVRRGPVETTTGMIRVNVEVQQESDDYWIARVRGSAPKCYAGQTRKEAIRRALKGASILPNAEGHPARSK